MNQNHIKKLYSTSIMELITQAHQTHKSHFKTPIVQANKLLSIKTGSCPEDCAYCPQSAHYQTQIQKESLLDLQTVIKKAKQAKKEGASRFCMGAGWRQIKDDKNFERVLIMVKEVHKLGLEVCCTLGMLSLLQAKKLKQAGLYAYNHNLDSSPEFYSKIISTRTYKDRLQSLNHVQKAGLSVCTGGILGMGESMQDRISLIHQFCLLKPKPESLTVNTLIPIKGTPLENQTPIQALEIVRFIAVCRILMPNSCIRLSAGRDRMSKAEQLLCFYSGANSLFIGDKLLTASNPKLKTDQNMLQSMGLRFKKSFESMKL